MKKVLVKSIGVFLFSLLIVCGNGLSANAENSKGMNITLGEIENDLMNYLKTNKLNYTMHSPELSQYLFDQLENQSDENLKKLSNYEDILAYAAEYLFREAIPNDELEVKDITEVPDLTLKEIKEDVEKQTREATENREEAKKNIIDLPDDKMIQGRALISNNHTANYAYTFALDYNREYNNYNNKGGDCTNFASQALRANGLKDGKTGYPTNYNWSSTRTNTGRKDSVAWISAEYFRLYWQMNGRSVTRHTSKASATKAASVGDILNYANKKSGRSWHNVVVTGKSNNTLYVSQHTSDKRHANWNNVDLNLNTEVVYVIKAK